MKIAKKSEKKKSLKKSDKKLDKSDKPWLFKKGKGANRDPRIARPDQVTGRPKGSISLTNLLRSALLEKIKDGPERGRTRGEILMQLAVVHALNGQPAFFKEIMARIDGPIGLDLFGGDPREKAREAMLLIQKMDADHSLEEGDDDDLDG